MATSTPQPSCKGVKKICGAAANNSIAPLSTSAVALDGGRVMFSDVSCREPEPKRCEQKAHETQQIDWAAWPYGADEYFREYPERSLGNRGTNI